MYRRTNFCFNAYKTYMQKLRVNKLCYHTLRCITRTKKRQVTAEDRLVGLGSSQREIKVGTQMMADQHSPQTQTPVKLVWDEADGWEQQY